MNDLKNHKHGDEGVGSTHSVCNKHNIGGESMCCECSGKMDCGEVSSTPPLKCEKRNQVELATEMFKHMGYKVVDATPEQDDIQENTDSMEEKLEAITKPIAYGLDEAVRDICAIPYRAKSEVRRIIQSLISSPVVEGEWEKKLWTAEITQLVLPVDRKFITERVSEIITTLLHSEKEKKGDNWRRGYMQGVAEEREWVVKMCEGMTPPQKHKNKWEISHNTYNDGKRDALSSLRDKLTK